MPLKSLHAVEVFENTVYIAPWSDSVIVIMDRFTMETKQIVNDVKRSYDFRIFHRQKQPEGKFCHIFFCIKIFIKDIYCIMQWLILADRTTATVNKFAFHVGSKDLQKLFACALMAIDCIRTIQIANLYIMIVF